MRTEWSWFTQMLGCLGGCCRRGYYTSTQPPIWLTLQDFHCSGQCSWVNCKTARGGIYHPSPGLFFGCDGVGRAPRQLHYAPTSGNFWAPWTANSMGQATGPVNMLDHLRVWAWFDSWWDYTSMVESTISKEWGTSVAGQKVVHEKRTGTHSCNTCSRYW